MSIVRKNQSQMSEDEQNAFKGAIDELINNGIYGRLIDHHLNMSHRMHGSMHDDNIAYERFLPWHRVYLVRFGEELRKINENLFVPYWRWSTDRQMPDWISDFLPQNIPLPDVDSISVERKASREDELPDKLNVNDILQENTWLTFSQRLEREPHNQVHRWVGGTMNTMSSPADPLFWMHHAEIDRIWEIWQSSHTNSKPSLSGRDAVLDPWEEYKAEDVLDAKNLGYKYDSLTL